MFSSASSLCHHPVTAEDFLKSSSAPAESVWRGVAYLAQQVAGAPSQGRSQVDETLPNGAAHRHVQPSSVYSVFLIVCLFVLIRNHRPGDEALRKLRRVRMN